jgi:hypothetical protein
MNFTCNECNDTGSRDKLGTYLDCNACGTASIRRDLNDFVKSLGPTHPEDVALAIHQRALAMGMSANVEDTLNEMQLGGALHMPQDPAGYVFGNQYWEAGNLRLTDEIKRLGTPLYEHAIPVLAMAPKQEAPTQQPVAWRYEWASYITCDGPQNFKLTFDIEPPPEWAVQDGQARNVVQLFAAPAAANGALTDEQIKSICESTGWIPEWNDRDHIKFARAILAAAGPDAALPDGYVMAPIKPTDAMLKAMAESRATDDEGIFPAMLDLLDFSGENKTRTVLEAAYVAALSGAKGN